MISAPTPIYSFNEPSANQADRRAPLITLSYANGFMPQTYTECLTPLFDRYRVVTPQMRPLWQPPPPTADLHHWRQLGTDLLTALDRIGTSPGVAIGHSVGAIAVLYAATMQPNRFRGVILIDPTLLPPAQLRLVWLSRLIGHDARMSLVKGALKRGNHWDTVDAAYTYFRGKRLFTRWPDQAVRVYAESITTPDPNGGVSLIFPREWEARIYQTIPIDVWQAVRKLNIPALVIRGTLSDVFTDASKAIFARLAPQIPIIDVPNVGHLVAQEAPSIVGDHIAQFANSLFP